MLKLNRIEISQVIKWGYTEFQRTGTKRQIPDKLLFTSFGKNSF